MTVHTTELSDFSPAERWALVRDGHAVITHGILCTVDTPPGPRLRLDAHLNVAHDNAVAIEQSALWVLGVGCLVGVGEARASSSTAGTTNELGPQ